MIAPRGTCAICGVDIPVQPFDSKEWVDETPFSIQYEPVCDHRTEDTNRILGTRFRWEDDEVTIGYICRSCITELAVSHRKSGGYMKCVRALPKLVETTWSAFRRI